MRRCDELPLLADCRAARGQCARASDARFDRRLEAECGPWLRQLTGGAGLCDGEVAMEAFKTLGLFIATALAEIVGC